MWIPSWALEPSWVSAPSGSYGAGSAVVTGSRSRMRRAQRPIDHQRPIATPSPGRRNTIALPPAATTRLTNTNSIIASWSRAPRRCRLAPPAQRRATTAVPGSGWRCPRFAKATTRSRHLTPRPIQARRSRRHCLRVDKGDRRAIGLSVEPSSTSSVSAPPDQPIIADHAIG